MTGLAVVVLILGALIVALAAMLLGPKVHAHLFGGWYVIARHANIGPMSERAARNYTTGVFGSIDPLARGAHAVEFRPGRYSRPRQEQS